MTMDGDGKTKAPERSSTEPLGQTIDDRYRVVERIGKGGMGTVYRAIDTKMGDRPVVVKMPHPHLVGDPDMVRRFREEMKRLATLDHPNIVKVHDTGIWQ